MWILSQGVRFLLWGEPGREVFGGVWGGFRLGALGLGPGLDLGDVRCRSLGGIVLSSGGGIEEFVSCCGVNLAGEWFLGLEAQTAACLKLRSLKPALAELCACLTLRLLELALAYPALA